MYLAVLIMILVLSGLAVVFSGGGLSNSSRYIDLFLLGAAFMLLETRAVTMFALLFGTTWLVNAIVFAGILVAVLLAVEFTRWFNRISSTGRVPPPLRMRCSWRPSPRSGWCHWHLCSRYRHRSAWSWPSV